MTDAASADQVGLRLRNIESDVSADVVRELGQLQTVFLSDAMRKFNAMDARVRPIVPGIPLSGPAFTVRPAPGDNLAVYMALDRARPGDVLVIESRGLTSVAQWGDLTSAIAKKAGIAGAVMDGAIRDRAGIVRAGLPVFAAPDPIATGGTRLGPGELNVPVAVGGVAVCAGDIIVGDDDGVVVVPAAYAGQVLERARVLAGDDVVKMTAAESGATSWGWLPEAQARAGYGATGSGEDAESK